MGKGSSTSDTSQSTSSATTSVAADNGGISLNSSTYTNDFGPGAQMTVHDILDFSGGVLRGAQNSLTDLEAANLQNQTNALNIAAAATNAAGATSQNVVNNAQLGQSSLLTNPATLTAIVAAIGLVAFLALRRRN